MNRFEPRGLAFISQTQDEQMRTTRVLPGDVLLNITGASIGRVCVAPADRCPANVNQHVAIIRSDGSLDPQFLSLYLSQPDVQSSIASDQAGATRQALTKAQIENFQIAAPSLEEQQRISAILREQLATVERARAAAEGQRTLLGNLVIAYLWESVADRGAERVRLADALSEVSYGVGDVWDQYRVVGATRAGLAPAKENVGKNPDRYKLVAAGTIFYNPMRILLGSIAMIDDDEEPGITSPDYVVFKTRDGVAHHRWLYYWMRSPMGESFIKTLTRGAVRERLLFRRLADAEIDLPPWDIQRAMADRFTQIAEAARAVADQLDSINHLPAALLSRAFNGEL